MSDHPRASKTLWPDRLVPARRALAVWEAVCNIVICSRGSLGVGAGGSAWCARWGFGRA
jgi:hypothetical protein